MSELVTKADLEQTKADLEEAMSKTVSKALAPINRALKRVSKALAGLPTRAEFNALSSRVERAIGLAVDLKVGVEQQHKDKVDEVDQRYAQRFDNYLGRLAVVEQEQTFEGQQVKRLKRRVKRLEGEVKRCPDIATGE